jgi:hypothetical protein
VTFFTICLPPSFRPACHFVNCLFRIDRGPEHFHKNWLIARAEENWRQLRKRRKFRGRIRFHECLSHSFANRSELAIGMKYRSKCQFSVSYIPFRSIMLMSAKGRLSVPCIGPLLLPLPAIGGSNSDMNVLVMSWVPKRRWRRGSSMLSRRQIADLRAQQGGRSTGRQQSVLQEPAPQRGRPDRRLIACSPIPTRRCGTSGIGTQEDEEAPLVVKADGLGRRQGRHRLPQPGRSPGCHRPHRLPANSATRATNW